MSEAMILRFAPIAILLLGGLMLIWWITSRLKRGGVRTLLRIITIPVFVLAAGVVGLMSVRSQALIVPQAEVIVTPSETMVVSTGTLTQTLDATGALAAADQAALSFGMSAPVTEIFVSLGDVVEAGTVLATIDTTSIEADIRSAELSAASAQASLDALTAPPSDLEIESAELNVQSAQASLSSASQTGSSETDIEIARLQEELSRNSLYQSQLSRDMSQANANPNQSNAYASEIASNSSLARSETSVEIAELETAATASEGPSQSQLASANAQYLSAQAALDSLLEGASESQIRLAEIEVEKAQLALEAVESQLSDAQLVAPFDGIVSSIGIDVGELPGAEAITLIDTSSYTLTLSVDERDISAMALGQLVNLSAQALPDLDLTGTVTHIDPTPTTENGLVSYSVEVTLNQSEATLRPGMTVITNVILNEVSGVLVVPNRFITTDPTTQQTTVKVQTAPLNYEDVPVTLGTQTANESEITSGIREGQTLVILPSATTSDEAAAGFNLLGGGLAGRGGGGAPPAGGNFPGGGGR